MANNHKYKFAYKLDKIENFPEGITVQEAHAKSQEGFGVCDAALIASIIYPEDGSYSVQFIPYDGRTGGVLDDKEMFKVWEMLALRLASSRTLHELDPGRLHFVQEVAEIIIARVRDARAAGEKEN